MMRERKRKRWKEIGKERMREKRQLASFQSVIDILLSNCLFCCSTVFLNNFFLLTSTTKQLLRLKERENREDTKVFESGN